MAETISRRSALRHLFETKRETPGRTERDPAVLLSVVPTFGAIDVRGAALDAAARALGFENDAAALSETRMGERAWLWIGPDQRWAIGPVESVAADLEALERAFGGEHHSLVEITDRLCAIEVGGPRARDVMTAICALDLHESVAPAGSVFSTHAQKANYALRVFEGGAFQLIANRSYADYLWRCLEQAAREFGYAAKG